MMHRIVLVDDDSDNACSSAIEAIDAIVEGSAASEFHRPLVITDLNMPQVDGFELISQLRTKTEMAPVIVVLSTSASRRDIAQAYRAGCNAYHVKPMGYVETKELARQIVAYWQPLLELA